MKRARQVLCRVLTKVVCYKLLYMSGYWVKMTDQRSLKISFLKSARQDLCNEYLQRGCTTNVYTCPDTGSRWLTRGHHKYHFWKGLVETFATSTYKGGLLQTFIHVRLLGQDGWPQVITNIIFGKGSSRPLQRMVGKGVYDEVLHISINWVKVSDHWSSPIFYMESASKDLSNEISQRGCYLCPLIRSPRLTSGHRHHHSRVGLAETIPTNGHKGGLRQLLCLSLN